MSNSIKGDYKSTSNAPNPLWGAGEKEEEEQDEEEEEGEKRRETKRVLNSFLWVSLT